MRQKQFQNKTIVVLGSIIALTATLVTGSNVDAMSHIEPLVISNNSNTNALSITQTGDVGASRSSSGAIVVDNTGNPNAALTLYSNSSLVTDPLLRLEIDSVTWDQPILHIRSDADTSHGLIRLDSSTPEIEFVETDQENDKGAGKFEVRVQHDQFQINSRRGDNTTFENAYTFTPFREGARFGIADYSPDASIEIVTNKDFPALFFSSDRDSDGDILEVSSLGDFNIKKGSIHISSGKTSTFKGGINIVDGCLAIDGECLTKGDLSNPESFPSVQDKPSVQLSSHSLKVIDSAPREIDCNSYTEQGTFMLDRNENKMWVCNGPERGWDYIPLTD